MFVVFASALNSTYISSIQPTTTAIQDPSSSVASALKLNAKPSIQPGTTTGYSQVGSEVEVSTELATDCINWSLFRSANGK